MTQMIAAAWLADPTGRHELRYWDGHTWSEHVADAGTTAVDPIDTGQTPPLGVTEVSGVAPAAAAPTPASGPAPGVRAEEVVDIVLNVAPDAARDATCAALQSRGFRLDFGDAWSAVARKGDKAMTVAFGTFAQYYEIVVQIFATPEGETIVRLSRSPTGYWTGGGLIGRARVKDMFARITNDVIAWFQQQGLLVGVRHTS